MFVTGQDRELVVFHLWPSMAFGRRLALSLALIALGLMVQAAMVQILPGILLVALGNALLLAAGYNNIVDLRGYEADAEWQKVERKRLDEIWELHKRIRKWDRSLVDVTSVPGLLMFLLIALALFVAFTASGDQGTIEVYAIAANAAVLLLPHWLTGVRRILTLPKLLLKLKTLAWLLDEFASELEKDKADVMMLLQGGAAAKLPSDVKLRIVPRGAAADFLGLQVQMAVNEVNGSSYIYLYAVLIAKSGFGLRAKTDAWSPPDKVIKEYPAQPDVEVLVIRQYTTRQSGYQTKPAAMRKILRESLVLARRVAA